MYIGLFYTLFGITDTAHYAIAFSQVLFASIMAVIAALIGSRYFSPKIGLMAGCFSALDPWLSFSTIAILNDNPFSFAYALSLLLCSMEIEKLTWRWALLWGLTLGLATFIRPLPNRSFPSVSNYIAPREMQHRGDCHPRQVTVTEAIS